MNQGNDLLTISPLRMADPKKSYFQTLRKASARVFAGSYDDRPEMDHYMELRLSSHLVGW